MAYVYDGTDLIGGLGSNTKVLETGTSIQGLTVFVGRACPDDPAVPAGNAGAIDIAVVERGVRTFTEKVAAVLAAGGTTQLWSSIGPATMHATRRPG